MKVKTLIHRIVDSDKFDAQIEKFLAEVEENKQEVFDVKTACGQNHLMAQIFYGEKKASGRSRSTKA